MQAFTLKLFLAFCVILSHANVYFNYDSILLDYSGYLSVPVFFYLSGLFLSQKYDKDFDFYDSIRSRLFRLLNPSIYVCFLLIFYYFITNKLDTNLFFLTIKNSLFFLGIDYNYECLYECSLQGGKLNSSLWSMPLELYVSLLFLLFSFWRFNYFVYVFFLVGVLIVYFYYPHKVFLSISFFLFGVLSNSIYKNYIYLISIISAFVLSYTFILLLPLVYFFNKDTLKKVISRRPKYDLTYICYLSAYPLQQIFYYDFAVSSFLPLVILTFISSLLIAIIYEKKL
jgi:peptidoglycan/LPS O-acetylase OafA/YrhL